MYDIAGTLKSGTWGYIVGTYDKDAGPNNQRLYLNGARGAQMSDTLPLDLNSNPLGIGRHVSGIADPSTATSKSSASPVSSAPRADLGTSADRYRDRSIHSAIDITTAYELGAD